MICDTLILKYDQSFGIDDVTVTVDEVEDV